MRTHFPPQAPGVTYLTEGGVETELRYQYGHQLPAFAAYPLLDQPQARAALQRLYARYLEVAAGAGMPVLMGGLDYRASADWAARLGYSHDTLREAQRRCIAFLHEVAEPFRGRIPSLLVSGLVGPRGDAYAVNRTITAADAEAYHLEQLATLAHAGVDLVTALTFNNVAEAVGVARAAARVDLPLAISFTLDSATSRLKSGPSLREAIEATDAQAGDARPDFYGINCSHPLEFEPALGPGDWIRRVRMLRPNASSKDKGALCTLGHLEEGDPQDLGARMGALARRYPHVDIWGGCCGTWDVHLGEIARAVAQARA